MENNYFDIRNEIEIEIRGYLWAIKNLKLAE